MTMKYTVINFKKQQQFNIDCVSVVITNVHWLMIDYDYKVI